MSLENYLNTTNFYNYAGITSSDVNASYVEFLIEKINNKITTKLDKLFTFTRDQTFKYYRYLSYECVVIGNWQEGGVVDSITITNAGTSYTSPPTVTFTGGGGYGAVARAVLAADGTLSTIRIIKQGRDYTTVPTISITEGGGSNATAVCTISPALIVKLGEDDDGTDDLDTLTVGDDYRLVKFTEQHEPTENYPVVEVKLYYDNLRRTEFLQITGTYGYSAYIPDDLQLDVFLYDYIKKAVQSAQAEGDSGGRGLIKSSRMKQIWVDFDNEKRMTGIEALEAIDAYLDNIVEEYTINPDLLPSIIG